MLCPSFIHNVFLWLRDLVPQGAAVPPASASGSLLYGTFWTVWERSTLLSQAVKQLTQLLVQAAIEVNAPELVHCNSLVISQHITTTEVGLFRSVFVKMGRFCLMWHDQETLTTWCWTWRWWCWCVSSLQDYEETDEKQMLHLADTLLDLLSVLVEFWCQQHFKLNQNLVNKGLKDLAEHFALISQGME